MLSFSMFLYAVYPDLRGSLDPDLVWKDRIRSSPVYPEPRRARRAPISVSVSHTSLHWPLPTIFLTYLESTLMRSPVSVASKELTGSLNPLAATLMKNRGVG